MDLIPGKVLEFHFAMETILFELPSIQSVKKSSKVKQSRYTPWRRLVGEEV
jgi:hypothetical protein